jgi:hypothetical protein
MHHTTEHSPTMYAARAGRTPLLAYSPFISNGTRTRARGLLLTSRAQPRLQCERPAVKSNACGEQFYGKSAGCEQFMCKEHHYDAYAKSLLCHIHDPSIDAVARSLLHKGVNRPITSHGQAVLLLLLTTSIRRCLCPLPGGQLLRGGVPLQEMGPIPHVQRGSVDHVVWYAHL